MPELVKNRNYCEIVLFNGKEFVTTFARKMARKVSIMMLNNLGTQLLL